MGTEVVVVASARRVVKGMSQVQLPPYAARVECQVKGVQQSAFKLCGVILGCVGWKPGESLPYERFLRNGKVDRAEHQERHKPLRRSKHRVRETVSRNIKEIKTYSNSHVGQVVSRLVGSIEIVPRGNSPCQRSRRGQHAQT